MTLQEFIDDCRRRRDQRRAQEQADRDEIERQFQELLANVIADVRQRLAGAIPQPLQQFTFYVGGRPTPEQLRTYPLIWTPTDFKVEAPGLLQLINFSVGADAGGPIRVREIRIGADSFGTDWVEAVAAASDPTGVK